jgi:hypothetical protein
VGLAVLVAALVGVVLALAAGAARTFSAPDRYVSSLGSGVDVNVEQAAGAPRTAEVAALPAVEDIRAATFVFGGLLPTGSSPAEGDDPVDAIVFAGSPAAIGTRVVEGREPRRAMPGEFVATRSMVEAAHLTLGQRFDLWVIPAGPAETSGFDAADQAAPLIGATLVGVVDGPSELQDGSSVAVFPEALLDAGDVGISATEMAVALAPGASISDLRSQIDGLPQADRFGIEPSDPVPGVVRDAVSAQGQGLAILALIAGLATVVVVGQLLGRQVRRSEVERLVLRTTGMTRSQIVADRVLDAAVPVVAGIAMAVGLAYLASGLFPRGFVVHVEPHPGRRVEPVALLGGAVALAVLVLAWVLVSVAVQGRERPGDSPAAVEAVARRVPVRVATAVRFAFTRQSREPIRPRAAVVGAAFIVAVLTGALTFGASLGSMVERPDRWGATFDLALGQGGDEVPSDARTQIESDPDVTDLTLYATVLATVGNEGFDVTGEMPVVGSTAPPVLEGRLPAGSDEIALGRVVARRLGAGVDDDVEVVGPEGPRTLRVSGLAVLPAVEGGDGVGEGGLVTFEGLRRIDPSVAPTAAGIGVRPGASPEAVARRLSERTGMTVGPGFDPPEVIVNIARARAIPYLVAAVVGALMLLNLAHHLTLSTRRRGRDLAVLRALGADRRWVTGVVHWQASVFTVVVVALGAPLGIAAGRVLYRAFVDRIGAVDTVTLPVGMFALALVGLVLLANVVAAPSARRARRRSPAAALTDE